MSFLTSMAPTFFKELLPYLPLKGFKVLPLTKLIPETIKLAAETAQGKRPYKTPTLPKDCVYGEGDILLKEAKLQEADQLRIGQKILELYFLQIRKDSEWPLDLSPEKFSLSKDFKTLYVKRSGPTQTFADSFVSSTRDLYQGYYEEKDEIFNQGLSLFGVSPGDKNFLKVREVFLKHFSEGRDHPLEFRISKFRESFEKIFELFIQTRTQVHPDFAFLGIRLVSLYLTLEFLQVPFDAKKAYFLES